MITKTMRSNEYSIKDNLNLWFVGKQHIHIFYVLSISLLGTFSLTDLFKSEAQNVEKIHQ